MSAQPTMTAAPKDESGTARQDRTKTRYHAACAIQLAARSLALDPAALPGLFVGWQRACEQVGALTDA
jgi:hypothetical protein